MIDFLRFAHRLSWGGWLFLLMLRAQSALAGSPTEIPPLEPPRPEIPPTFWEANSALITLGALLLAASVFALFWWMKHRPAEPGVPPETRARKALDSLRSVPVDGWVLSRISQVVREYFDEAFELNGGQMTTVEFGDRLTEASKASPALRTRTINFLQRCDELKFAGSASPVNTSVLQEASEIIDDAAGQLAILNGGSTQAPQNQTAPPVQQ